MIGLSEDERRNGWDEDSLERYLTERASAQMEAIDPISERRRRGGRAEVANRMQQPTRRW